MYIYIYIYMCTYRGPFKAVMQGCTRMYRIRRLGFSLRVEVGDFALSV